MDKCDNKCFWSDGVRTASIDNCILSHSVSPLFAQSSSNEPFQ